MLTVERHDRIRAKLAVDGKVLANDLAVEFGVSEDTVRRDLRELAKAGVCRRVYGGALSPAPDLGTITERQEAMVGSKLRLAAAVASMVVDGQTIFIDAGSTNLAIANALPRDLSLTVLTNAPAIALALADHSACRTQMLGGQFNAAKGACLGAQTIRDVERLHADVLILGTCGIDARAGVTALDGDEAELKRSMVAQSASVVVPATIDKLATVAPFGVAPIERIAHLVVTSDAGRDKVEAFAERGINVHYA